MPLVWSTLFCVRGEMWTTNIWCYPAPHHFTTTPCSSMRWSVCRGRLHQWPVAMAWTIRKSPVLGDILALLDRLNNIWNKAFHALLCSYSCDVSLIFFLCFANAVFGLNAIVWVLGAWRRGAIYRENGREGWESVGLKYSILILWPLGKFCLDGT